MDSTVIVLIAAGFLSIFRAVMDYDWFINSRKAKLLVKLFGRNDTRIFMLCLAFLSWLWASCPISINPEHKTH